MAGFFGASQQLGLGSIAELSRQKAVGQEDTLMGWGNKHSPSKDLTKTSQSLEEPLSLNPTVLSLACACVARQASEARCLDPKIHTMILAKTQLTSRHHGETRDYDQGDDDDDYDDDDDDGDDDDDDDFAVVKCCKPRPGKGHV